MSLTPESIADAVCVLANYRQFHVGESLRNPRVESRMLLWNLRGAGVVTVNGTRLELTPELMLVLPWRHSVSYQAAARDPYLLAGVHIIPRHAPGESRRGTRHGHSGEPITDDPARQDADWPWLRGLLRLQEPAHGALRLLAESIVERWQGETPPDWERRLQARLLLPTLAAAVARGPAGADAPPDPALPSELRRVLRYLREHLGRSISLAEMAGVAGCSASTLGRLFARHLRCTPVDWLREARVTRARELLAATPLSIAQVAAQVGMPDVPYFAKVFKRVAGEPPAAYRKRVRIF